MPPQAVEARSLNTRLYHTLGRRIVSGFYAEHHRLPIESELCKEFGVSRAVIREATKILFAKGLLISRPRIGTMVANRDLWNLLDRDVLSWTIDIQTESSFLNKLFEVRQAIEPAAAELAARHATESEIQRIGEACQQLESAQSPTESLEPDIRFHQCIMAATHNDLMRFIGNTLHNVLALSVTVTNHDEEILKNALHCRRDLYLAIKNHDTAAARAATIFLLDTSRREYEISDAEGEGKKSEG